MASDLAVGGWLLSVRRRQIALLAFVVSFFFSFPHPIAGSVLDLGFVLAFVAPALLLLAASGLPPRRAAGVAFLATWLAHSAVVHWIYVVTVRYGHAPAVVGVIAPIGMSLYPALFGAAFGLAAAWLSQRDRATPLALAALWTALDHARSFVISGWPWATLGYAHHENGWLLGLSSATGVYGLSFVSALLSFCALDVARTRRLRAPAIAGLGVGALLLASGAALSGSPDAVDGDETVRIAALQGNVSQDEKWSAGRLDRVLDNYAELTRRAAAQGAQIVVWPETAFAGLLELDPIRFEALAELARETRSALVVGAVGSALTENGRAIEHHYDSAFVFAPDGRLLDRYDKTHLVPFGEYLPFRSLIGRFVRAVATGVASGDVSPGVRVRAVDVEIRTAGGETRSVRLGIPICYELLFPDLVRRFSADGARALLAITNDAWYGRTGAPYQFLAMTALRAAESGVPTVRAANSGVSAAIAADGRVAAATRIFERDLIVRDVLLRRADATPTLYVQHGDVFALACWLGVLVSLGLAGRAGASRREQETRG